MFVAGLSVTANLILCRCLWKHTASFRLSRKPHLLLSTRHWLPLWARREMQCLLLSFSTNCKKMLSRTLTCASNSTAKISHSKFYQKLIRSWSSSIDASSLICWPFCARPTTLTRWNCTVNSTAGSRSISALALEAKPRNSRSGDCSISSKQKAPMSSPNSNSTRKTPKNNHLSKCQQMLKLSPGRSPRGRWRPEWRQKQRKSNKSANSLPKMSRHRKNLPKRRKSLAASSSFARTRMWGTEVWLTRRKYQKMRMTGRTLIHSSRKSRSPIRSVVRQAGKDRGKLTSRNGKTSMRRRSASENRKTFAENTRSSI